MECSDPREVIVDYLRRQRLADEAGVYDHADRIESLLEASGWVLIRRSEVAKAVIIATEARDRIPRLSGPELALSTHRSLDHIVRVLDSPSSMIEDGGPAGRPPGETALQATSPSGAAGNGFESRTVHRPGPSAVQDDDFEPILPPVDHPPAPQGKPRRVRKVESCHHDDRSTGPGGIPTRLPNCVKCGVKLDPGFA